MRTVVTGGHLTMFSLMRDWFFSPYMKRADETDEKLKPEVLLSVTMALTPQNALHEFDGSFLAMFCDDICRSSG